MKKLFLFAAMIGVLAISLVANVGVARAGGVTIEFVIQGVSQQDLNNAYLFSFSEYHEIECVLKDEETGLVACHVPERFAGGDARLYVAGQTFYVTAPLPRDPNNANGNANGGITWPANGRPFGHWPNSAYDYCDASAVDIDMWLYYETVSPNNWIAGAPGQTLPSPYVAHSMLPNYPTTCNTFYSQGHADTRP